MNKKNIKHYQNVKKVNINDNKLYFLNNNLYDNENDNSNIIYLNYKNEKSSIVDFVKKIIKIKNINNYKLLWNINENS